MIDLSDRTELALIALAVNHVRQSGAHDFFIVGAQARDVLLKFHHGIDSGRATREVDFGVMVESWQEYAALRDALVNTGQFTASGEEQRLRFGDMPVDLVPFGRIETVNGTIVWPRSGQTMNAVGFREALAREPFDYEFAGAWLLGRDAGRMHRDAEKFTSSVTAILTSSAGRANFSTLVSSMGGQTMSDNAGLAESFRDGLQRGLQEC